MSKLYATIKSERISRPARKGGDKKLEIELTRKGIPEYNISYTSKGFKVRDPNENTIFERGR